MSAVLSHESQNSPSGLAAVPKAMWAVLGTLALATAGLAGALITKSTQKDPVPVAVQQPAPAAAQLAPMQQANAERVIPQAPADMPEPAPAPKAKPAPVKVAKPAPPKPQVQQATGSATAAAPAVQGSSTHMGEAPAQQPVVVQAAPVCHTCGTVQAVQEVKLKAEQGSGIGAVGGAVVGGLLGNQVGKGNGRTAMTVLGAVGGGLAGNEVEKRVRTTTMYDVQVRMEDGSVRTVRSSQPVGAGTRVFVEGGQLRVAGPNTGSVQPGTLRTSGTTS